MPIAAFLVIAFIAFMLTVLVRDLHKFNRQYNHHQETGEWE